MKDLRRALRRHHRARFRKRAEWIMKELWGYRTDDISARQLGRHTATRTPCSCWMCGNPRRYFGEKTFRERRDSKTGAADFFE